MKNTNRLGGALALVLFCAGTADAYETIPAWTLQWSDDARTVGTLTTDEAHGGWVINVRLDKGNHGGYGLMLGNLDSNGKMIWGSAVASGGGDTGELDLRGTITGPGLDGTGTSTAWKISRMQDHSMATNKEGHPALAVKKLVTPGTLVSYGLSSFYHNDASPRPTVTEVIIDEPNVESIPQWLTSGCTSLKKLVLRLPKATSMYSYTAHWQAPQAETLLDEFDLTGLTTLGGNGNGKTGEGGALQNWQAKGTFHLPSLVEVTLSNACKSCGMQAAILGTKGNLKSIGAYSFASTSLTNLVLGASPSGTTLKLGVGAFQAYNLKNVWFGGDCPPTCATADGVYTFGNKDTAEGSMTFHVPDTPGWAEVIASADADGTVAPEVFNTRHRQKLVVYGGFARIPDITSLVVDKTLGAVYGDGVKAEGADTIPYANYGLYALPITLTATNSATPDAEGRASAFHRWDGVPASRERENPLTLTAADKIANVRCFFSHDWLYDPAASTIANGNWVINVHVSNAAQKKLNLGKSKGNGVFSTVYTGTGSGVLDFTGKVRTAEGEEWTLTGITAYGLTKLRNWNENVDTYSTFAVDHPTVVVMPETLESIGGELLNYNQSRQFVLRELYIIAPNYAGNLNLHLNGNFSLTRLVIRTPKVKRISGWCFWQDANLTDTDASTWDLSGVTTVEESAFLPKAFDDVKGTLALPSLKTLGKNNFQNCTALEGAVLATNLTLTSIGHNAFAGATGLKTLTLGNAKAGTSLGTNLFAKASALTSVTFLGPRDEALADATLAGVAATDGAKAATVHASRDQRWDESAAKPTEAEAALAPEGALGVYRDGARKAWLVNTPTPFDPKWFYIIVK